MQLSVTNPASVQAADLLRLWVVCLWICGIILAIVTGAIVYILIRYRRRSDSEPAQTPGNLKLEIAWTAIPIALVGFLFVMSILTARAVDRPVHREPDVVVTGHQWWWEVTYPLANAVTANEIHIPAGRDILIAVEAADVIHDFWVPQLGRKMDAIPGKRSFVWIHANQTGDYSGACAEFCGAQHAWMRFRVIAEDSAVYEQWLLSQTAAANQPSGEAESRGAVRFHELTCGNCHNVRGANEQKQHAPDLTHIASRKMLAADRLENTPQGLKEWLRAPDLIKPGCNMPNLKLSESDLTDLTAYLEGLR